MVKSISVPPVDQTTNIATAEPAPSSDQKPQHWYDFGKEASALQVMERVNQEMAALASEDASDLKGYCILSLYNPIDGITSWDSNRIFTTLQSLNPNRDKNVFLILLSPGGQIEPAFQISKLCKTFALERFTVAVPRAAKSAATLLALGADEIHMSLLGELGPIDPQLGDLPALGVKKALETIASVSQQYPASAETFARYMSRTLTIEQIGYCERAAESAVQYAERLLEKKPYLLARAASIANQLVYEYKHHNFVIDIEEARQHLGEGWVLGESPEIRFAEKVHQKLDLVNLVLGIHQKKRIMVVGNLLDGCLVLDKD